jgi:hypothetical protein
VDRRVKEQTVERGRGARRIETGGKRGKGGAGRWLEWVRDRRDERLVDWKAGKLWSKRLGYVWASPNLVMNSRYTRHHPRAGFPAHDLDSL